jgi:hypothetical protein
MSAQQILDQAYGRAQLEALAADPAAYAAALAGELPEAATLAELEASDAVLAGALDAIDVAVVRAMRVWLDHADVALAPVTRNVFATTIVAYAADLGTLGQRAYDAAARGRAADPASVADAVVLAGRRALALREGLRAGVLALIATRAEAAIADADRHARDRKLDDATRRRWSALRRDREQLAAQPHLVAVAPFAARLAAWPDQLDEPAAEAEPTFAQMIELD